MRQYASDVAFTPAVKSIQERRFPRPRNESILGRLSWSAVGEFDRPTAEPRDGGRVAVECRFTEDRVVTPPVELDGETVVLGRHGTGGLDEPAVELLWVGLLEPIEARRQ